MSTKEDEEIHDRLEKSKKAQNAKAKNEKKKKQKKSSNSDDESESDEEDGDDKVVAALQALTLDGEGEDGILDESDEGSIIRLCIMMDTP